MGEAFGKLLTVVVDGLTPRSIRLLLVLLLVANGYGWWQHDQRLAAHEKAILEYRVEMAGLRAALKAVLARADEGNSELRGIRQLLMDRR